MVVGAAALLVLIGEARDGGEPVRHLPPLGSIEPVKPAGSPRDASFAAIVLARPLFSPTRRPPARPTSDPAAPLPHLAGTIIQDDLDGRAILAVGDEQTFVLRRGERSHGLTLVTVEAGRAVVEITGGLVTLELGDGRKTVSPTIPAASDRAFVMTKDPRSRAADNQDE